MTTTKRLAPFAAPIAAIAIMFGVLAILPPRPAVTKANFDRIEKGMTLKEVEEIFGQRGKGPWFPGYWEVNDGSAVEMCWRADDESWAAIQFFHDCVTEKAWHDSNETILDKIRRWLHLD